MTSATSHGSSAGAAGSTSGTGAGGPAEERRVLRDRTGSAALPPVAPAVPVLTACLGAAVSLALLCVLAVVVPAPRIAAGPVVLAGGPHDQRVLVFLVLVTLAGSALGIGLLRGALPRAEAAGAGASVDRSALVVVGAGATLGRIAATWALAVLVLVLPAWLGLLPLPVVGLVLPLAVATCAPALAVRRVAVASSRRRGLAVLAPSPGAAVSGALTVAGPVRAAPPPVVLTGELLARAPGRGRPGDGPPGSGGRPGGPGRPAPGEWGFQAGPSTAGGSGAADGAGD